MTDKNKSAEPVPTAGNTPEPWMLEAAHEIYLYDNEREEDYDADVARIISLAAPLQIDFSDSPCGHSSRYSYTSDGGKNIICLLCERVAASSKEATPNLEPWMTREAFEWMEAALGLDAELHPFLSDLIPPREEVSGEERKRWQKVVEVIFRSADHADAMPQVLKDRAPRKGPHSLKLRREV